MKKILRPTWIGLGAVIIFLHTVMVGHAAIFSTISTNGPATNRINLVFFSEGYTNGQQGNFLADATNAANVFFNAQPYAEYSNYFNVFAVFTNSAHAGSTHLSYPMTYVNGFTYFNSTFDSSANYIITIPPNPSDANNSHGQGKIDALLQFYLPVTNNDLPALLVNDPNPGGSDNYGKSAITSIGDLNILVHESGHTLGGLGDEYSYASVSNNYPDIEEPNTTTNILFSKIKWNAWISTNTPLPTPFSSTYQDTVGLFQGAHYHTTGWYRPFENCCMQSFDSAFCPVCQETLVLALYGKIRPVETRLPTTNSLLITSNQLLTFSLSLLKPSSHSLNIQWRTNSVAVNGATNQVFNLWPSDLGIGTNKVEAFVWDETALVRTDAKNLLKQTNLWTVNVALLLIDSVSWQTNGSFALRVTGTTTNNVVIQISTNLIQWAPVRTNVLNNGQLLYVDSGAATNSKRFYRAKTPP